MQPDVTCFTGLTFFKKVVSSLHLIIDHLHVDYVRGEAFPEGDGSHPDEILLKAGSARSQR